MNTASSVALEKQLPRRTAAIEDRLSNTIPVAADRLGISTDTLRRRIADGTVKTTVVCGRRMIAETELLRVARGERT